MLGVSQTMPCSRKALVVQPPPERSMLNEKASCSGKKNQLFLLNEMKMNDRTQQNIFILIFAFQGVAFLSPAFSHH